MHRMPGERTILLAGATGLVGRHCLRAFLEDPGVQRVVTLTRRPLPELHAIPPSALAKLESRIVDFSRLASVVDLPRVDQVCCALGTTIKQAGSRANFREVDYDYPVALARRGIELEATHFLLVSALSANPDSAIFYSRVKGETERTVRELPYRSVTIVRPSVLLGERSEFRLAEELAKHLAFLTPRRYAPVAAAAVAATLVRAAREDHAGVRIIESAQIA